MSQDKAVGIGVLARPLREAKQGGVGTAEDSSGCLDGSNGSAPSGTGRCFGGWKRIGELAQYVSAGMSKIQSELNLEDRALEAVYALGYGFYSQGRYTDAGNVFSFLLFLKPHEHRYWFGLASASQMAGKMGLAATSFFFATLVGPERPAPYLHLAECLLVLEDRAGAVEHLERAVKLAQGCGDRSLGRRAAVLLEALRGREQEGG